MKGTYTPKIPEGDNGKGKVIVRAAYTDKSAKGSEAITTEEVKVLRSAELSPGTADTLYRAEVNLQTMFAVSLNIIPKANGYIGFKQIDLTGIPQMEIGALAFPMMGYIGGTIEVRLDKPDGELLGQVNIESKNPNFGGSAANAAQNSGGAKTKQLATAPLVAKKPSTPAPRNAGANRQPSTAKRKPSTGIGNPFAMPGIKTDIKPVSGLHDLYFVFKNENAKGDQPLMSVSNIKFNNKKQP